ncbi:MAG: hypothetical protein ABIL40_01455 [candidate division WOR-3 bacterium]
MKCLNTYMPKCLKFFVWSLEIKHCMSYGVGDAGYETDTCLSVVQDNIFYANDSFPLIISSTELGECKNNQFVDNRHNAILIRGGGDITKSLSIQNQGVPYVIDCWFVVNSLLEIEKGNIFQFKGQSAWFKPQGILKATGVTFTAYDTVWWGMKFDNSKLDTSVLDSCILEKARN